MDEGPDDDRSDDDRSEEERDRTASHADRCWSGLETASADRDDWAGTTPLDAGEALFGPVESVE